MPSSRTTRAALRAAMRRRQAGRTSTANLVFPSVLVALALLAPAAVAAGGGPTSLRGLADGSSKAGQDRRSGLAVGQTPAHARAARPPGGNAVKKEPPPTASHPRGAAVLPPDEPAVDAQGGGLVHADAGSIPHRGSDGSGGPAAAPRHALGTATFTLFGKRPHCLG